MALSDWYADNALALQVYRLINCRIASASAVTCGGNFLVSAISIALINCSGATCNNHGILDCKHPNDCFLEASSKDLLPHFLKSPSMQAQAASAFNKLAIGINCPGRLLVQSELVTQRLSRANVQSPLVGSITQLFTPTCESFLPPHITTHTAMFLLFVRRASL